MRYLSRCLNCGWNEESDFIATEYCPNCDERLRIEDTKYDDMIAQQIEEKVNIKDTNKQIDMFKKIDILGYAKCWKDIENIKDPIIRVSRRKLFLKVGGQIPDRS